MNSHNEHSNLRGGVPRASNTGEEIRFAGSLRYALAILFVGAALGVGLLLQNFHFRVPATALLLFAVAIVSWKAGRGPAVLADILATISCYWFFVEPVRTIYINYSEIPWFIIFTGFAVLLCWFGTIRRRIEAGLREQASLLNLTHDAIFVMDMEGVITYWNRGAEERYGWPAEQVVGKVVHDLLKTRFPGPLEEIRAEVTRTDRWEGEIVHTKKDGTQVVIASRWALQRDARGAPVAILETNNDITERRRTEADLRASEERFRALVQFSFDVYWESDAQHRFTRQEFAEGLADAPAPGSEIGKTRWEVPYLEPDEAAWRQHRATLDAHLPFRDFELARPAPDGGKRYVSVSGLPLFDATGRFIGYRGVGRHITDRKRAEQALRQSEAYLAEAQRLSHTGSWSWSPATRQSLYWSEEMFRIFGLNPQEGVPTSETFWQRIHPEDLDRTYELLMKAALGNMEYEHEHRIVLPDGTVKHIHAIGHPILDENGQVAEYVGTAVDVTEHKRAEEALRRSETYLAEAQRLAHTGSWAFDVANNKYIYASEECLRIFEIDAQQGLPTREAVSRLIHPEDWDRVNGDFEKSVREKVDTSSEFRITLPSGTAKHLQAIRHPVLNSAADVVTIVGTVMDITERKRAEEERRAHLWFLESMDRINRAMQGSHDLEQVMSDVLEAVRSIFACDRAWLVYPCDPQAPTWRVAMEHTRPEFPGAFVLGLDLPVDPEVARVFETARSSGGAVRFGPGADQPVPAELAERFKIQAMIAMVVPSKLGQPYLFGLHQCSGPRVWAPTEDRLFQEIGRRLTDALTSVLIFRSLRESERRLEEAQRIAHVGYWDRDLDAGRITLSDEGARIFGLQPEERVVDLAEWHGRWQTLIHPEDGPRVVAAAKAALAGGPRYDVEYRVVHRTGEVRIVHSQGDVIRDASGRPYRMFGIMQDITDPKRAEESLRQSEAYLAEAQRLSHTGSWAFDVASDKLLYASEEFFRIFGLDAQEGLPSREDLSQLIHPEDWDRANGSIEEQLREKVDITIEYRIVLPSGKVKHIQSMQHPVLNDAGDIVKLVGTVMDITERKRAEEERRESAERFRAIADYTYDWESWIGVDGTLLWVNPAVERITGYSVDECMVMPGFPVPIVAEADRETVARQIGEAIQGSSRNDFELRVRHKDGRLIWVAASWQPIYDSRGARLGHRSSIRDIGERKQAEEALRRSETYLAEAQRLSHTGSWAFDMASDKFVYVSEECLRIFELDAQEGLPTREAVSRLIHPQDRDRVKGDFETSLGEKVDTSSEFRIALPSGTLKHIQAIRHPVLNDAGEVVQLVGTVIDMTERKRAEEERDRLRQLEAELAHINRVSLMGELASSVAHEVNQPLSGVVSNANACLRWLAGDAPNLEEARETARRIVRDGKRAAEVIARIRALAKRAETPKERLDLNETMREVLVLVGDEAKRKSVNVRMQFADDLSPVAGDQVQLQQVVLNLVMNGIEAMSSVGEGARELVITTRNLDPDQVQVTVDDSGTGLDPDVRDKIFDPFYTTKPTGMGMGLSISRSILEAHGGRLWATAKDGPGAVFHFTLPRYHEEASNA